MKKSFYINLLLLLLLVFGMYKFFYTDLNTFGKDESLIMTNLNLSDKDIPNILKYAENNKIKKLYLSGNKFSNLNAFFNNSDYTFELLDLGNIGQYFFNKNNTSYLDAKNIIFKLENKYKNIYFNNKCISNKNTKCLSKTINIKDFSKDWVNLQLYINNKNKVFKNLDFKFDHILNIEKEKNSFLEFLNDYKLQNSENNLNLNITYFDDFTNKYNESFIDIYDEKLINKRNFELSFDFFNKIMKFELNVNLKGKYDNYFNKYFNLKNNKFSSNTMYNNLFIDKIILDDIILKYKNTKKLTLKNIKSQEELIIDLDKTEINNFNLIDTKFKIINNNGKKHNLLVNNRFSIVERVTDNSKYINFPDFIKNNTKGKYLFATRNTISKNEKIGHYRFNDTFSKYLSDNFDNLRLIIELNINYKDDIFIKHEISDINFERIWFKYKTIGKDNNDFYITKKVIDDFLLINKEMLDYNPEIDFGTGASEKENFKIKINKIFKSINFSIFIRDLFKYIDLLNNFSTSFESNDVFNVGDYNNPSISSNKVYFNEVFKYGETYIYIKDYLGN